jgi:hypothetical protein
MKQSLRRAHAWIGLAGGVGGAINAAFCFFRWPAGAIDGNPTLHWHLIPAGCVHGAVLALGAVLGAGTLARYGWGRRVVGTVAVGWVAGYLSWILLNVSALDATLLKSLVWPIANPQSVFDAAWAPFFHFGGVALLLCAWLTWRGWAVRPAWHVLAAVLAGVFGSLWWWIAWGPWYFSLLHGGVWGLLAGSAIWRSRPVGGHA